MRSIFISGANQGIGHAACVHLAQKPNILLFMASRKISAAEEAIESLTIDATSKVVPVQLDITNLESVENAKKTVEKVLKESGEKSLDVLVNNAGLGVGTYEQIFSVNVTGTANLTTSFFPLISSPGGSIINMSSELGSSFTWDVKKGLDSPYFSFHFSVPEAAFAYPASKAAVNNLTQLWAAREHMKKSGIRVISLCPGYTSTQLNGFKGTNMPEDASMIIVNSALEKNGLTQVFYNKEGSLAW